LRQLASRARAVEWWTVVGMLHLPFRTRAVGVSWYQDAIIGLFVGDSVEVHHEPNNDRDANAMLITAAGRKIGYLSRPMARRMAKEGIRSLSGTISEVSGLVTLGVELLIDSASEGTSAAPVRQVVVEETPVSDGRTVRVRGSGRQVGTLIAHDRERGVVLVRGPRGTVEYGDDLVVIDELVAT
jgi:hypothetical protein